MIHVIRVEETETRQKHMISGEYFEIPVYRVLIYDDDRNRLYYEYATFDDGDD